MKKEYEVIKKHSGGNSLLIILVGESGVGKSTFCQFIDRPDSWYSSSGAIAKKLKEQGEPITHDTIHNFANHAYAENPEWQVPSILESMDGKKYLILDGPRRIKEVRALKREHPNILVLRVTADEEERFKRLQLRDVIHREEFDRVLLDESEETELSQLLAMANMNIKNNGNLEKIKKEAEELRELLDNL